MSVFRRIGDRMQLEGGHRIYGVVVGIVTDNKQPDGKYMVKVRFPWLPNGDESGQSSEQSDWLRVTSFMAGNGRGMYCLPEVGDEVLVAFEHGDAGRGYVIGTLWNKNDVSILDNKGGKNEKRSWYTRAGHKIEIFDPKDAPEKGSILIETKGKAKIFVCDDKKKIDIYDQSGENFIQVDGQNKTLNVKTADKINMECTGEFKIKCEKLTIDTSADTKVTAGGNIKMKASSNFEAEASGSGKVQSSGAMTIKGSTVNIN